MRGTVQDTTVPAMLLFLSLLGLSALLKHRRSLLPKPSSLIQRCNVWGVAEFGGGGILVLELVFIGFKNKNMETLILILGFAKH